MSGTPSALRLLTQRIELARKHELRMAGFMGEFPAFEAAKTLPHCIIIRELNMMTMGECANLGKYELQYRENMNKSGKQEQIACDEAMQIVTNALHNVAKYLRAAELVLETL